MHTRNQCKFAVGCLECNPLFSFSTKFSEPLQPSKGWKIESLKNGKNGVRYLFNGKEVGKITMGDVKDDIFIDDKENLSLNQPSKEECNCGCHTSKSSSEDMKKSGCDLCYCDSEYYPRHPKPSKEEKWEKELDEYERYVEVAEKEIGLSKKEVKCTNCGETDYTEAIEFDNGMSFCRKCCEKPMGIEPSKKEPESNKSRRQAWDTEGEYGLKKWDKEHKKPEFKCKKGFYDMDCYSCKDMVECLDKPESKEEEFPYAHGTSTVSKPYFESKEPESKEDWEIRFDKLSSLLDLHSEECVGHLHSRRCKVIQIKQFIRSEKEKSFLNGCKQNDGVCIHSEKDVNIPESKEEWEERFDKKFVENYSENKEIELEKDELYINQQHPKKIKNFIRSEKKKSEEFGRQEELKLFHREWESEEEEWRHRENQALDKRNKEIQKLIVDEILVAQKEGQPTSRLTSLSNKLSL